MDIASRQLRKLLGKITGLILVVGATSLLSARKRGVKLLPRWILWVGAVTGAAIIANEIGGKPVPFLRWSFLRMAVRMKHLTSEWQVGDGRESALAEHVLAHAQPGDVDDAIRVIDDFCRTYSFLINVGDEKGEILERAVKRVQPGRALELGTYCGYSALRTVRAMPANGHLYSVEFNPANAEIARQIFAHAGIDDRVTVVVGTLGDGGRTLSRLRDEFAFTKGCLDFAFFDHDKNAYVSDLQLVINEGWLHPGSVVVADNILVPGAPAYRTYMNDQDGALWRTTEHRAHVEYQSLIKDMVLESDYLGS
jgi:predicted O-methyltransferase YrrM